LASTGHPEKTKPVPSLPVPSLYGNLSGSLCCAPVHRTHQNGVRRCPGLGHVRSSRSSRARRQHQLCRAGDGVLCAPIRVLRLIKHSFGRCNRLVSTIDSTDSLGNVFPELSSSNMPAQAFRRLLAMNKRSYEVNIDLTGIFFFKENRDGPPRASSDQPAVVGARGHSLLCVASRIKFECGTGNVRPRLISLYNTRADCRRSGARNRAGSFRTYNSSGS